MPETIKDAPKRPAKTPKPAEGNEGSLAPKKKPVAPKKTGRPSKYDPEIARIICEQLSEGVPLRQICRANDGFPAWRTVYDWMAKDDAAAAAGGGVGLSASIARARDIGYDAIAEECLYIADTQTMTERVTEAENPATGALVRSVVRSDDVNARRLQVETRLKLLAKFHPTKYGDKLGLHGVDGAAPILTADARSEALFDLIRNMEMTKRVG